MGEAFITRRSFSGGGLTQSAFGVTDVSNGTLTISGLGFTPKEVMAARTYGSSISTAIGICAYYGKHDDIVYACAGSGLASAAKHIKITDDGFTWQHYDNTPHDKLKIMWIAYG